MKGRLSIASLLLACSLALPLLSRAETAPAVGLHAAYVANTGPDGSHFDGAFQVQGFGQLQFHPQFAIEAGLAYSSDTEDSATDNQGSYSITMSSNDLFAGVRLETRPMGVLTLYGRGGVLYYYTTIDFAESFFDIKPGGKIKEIEEGSGYYLEGGLALKVATGIKLDFGLTYRARLDYFEDSSRAFDMKELGASVGLVFDAF